MKFEGTYAGWGNLSVIFQTSDNECLKIYRRYVRETIPKQEYDVFNEFYGKGIHVPKPREITQVEFSSVTIDQIANKILREEFGSNGGMFTAFRRDFIPGTIMGRSWLGSRKVWRNYVQLNEAVFAAGYTPYDFIPHNYIVREDGEVFFIDADKIRKLSPHELSEERHAMKKVPNTRFGRAIFDIKRGIIEAFSPSPTI